MNRKHCGLWISTKSTKKFAKKWGNRLISRYTRDDVVFSRRRSLIKRGYLLLKEEQNEKSRICKILFTSKRHRSVELYYVLFNAYCFFISSTFSIAGIWRPRIAMIGHIAQSPWVEINLQKRLTLAYEFGTIVWTTTVQWHVVTNSSTINHFFWQIRIIQGAQRSAAPTCRISQLMACR